MEGYGLVKKLVTEDSDLLGKTLRDFKLPEKGILVLGIERGNKWLPIPHAGETIQKGDKLVVYGTYETLDEVFADPYRDNRGES